ncbi:site-specific integrase [Cupriavidus pauculus]|uniref:site-specific integrase n=1 Tax=Cupriavidus pauculus TaxID=82633 RepID=UPI0012FE2DAE|nr:site-specific integrase [Cupriavidus pauculus]
MDENFGDVTLKSIKDAYVDWTGWLNMCARAGRFGYPHAYAVSITVGKILTESVGSDARFSASSGVKPPGRAKFNIPPSGDDLNFDEAQRFGEMLLDISDSLTEEAIRGPLPVKIVFRSGKVIEKWLRLGADETELRTLAEGVKPSTRDATLEKRQAYGTVGTNETRFPLLNLRLLAELLIFISQTTSCLKEASKLQAGNFSYRSDVDGYKVSRVYKNRRHGPVEFTIYKEYRPYFERFLKWRKRMFPNSPLMFPFIRFRQGADNKVPKYKPIREICKQVGVPFIGARRLRKIHQNWFLRRSQDADLTAAKGNHSKDVLLRVYAKPDKQIAIVELAKYHQQKNPLQDCPGPGVCIEKHPDPLPGIPDVAASPDCINAAGCLFCFHNRDINSLDHVWSLSSYRHLKTLELGSYRILNKDKFPSPARALIERITEKLKAFADMGKLQSSWVEEALARVDEGDFHPKWDGFIRLVED